MKRIKDVLLLLAAGCGTSFLFYKADMILPVILIAVAVAILAIFGISRDIKWGFYFLMAASFFSNGLTRYAPGLPLGLLTDFILVGIFATYFLQRFQGAEWSKLANFTFFAILAWMIINLMEIVNPASCSFEAWFYAMRGVSLYLFLTVLVGFLCLEFHIDFKWFINLWFVFSIMGAFWGMKQLVIGLDYAEKAWLSVTGNLTTHMLFGKLRVFSFYSDAGQFGASQAHTFIVAALMAVNETGKKRRYFYIATAFICLYGMLISGTRGAIAIPVIGFFAYLALIRNFKIIVIGVVVFAIIFGLLKFTSVGQGIYQINRLRTALNPNDASLQVRIENQKKLKNYLDGHIFGGGIGSAGYWGSRFCPNTFLANLALDSWYVRIAAEFGYIGLVFYLIVLLIIIFNSLRSIQLTTDPNARNALIAIFCGLAGILVASYTNQVFGQVPTAILIYITIVFLAKPVKEKVHEAVS